MVGPCENEEGGLEVMHQNRGRMRFRETVDGDGRGEVPHSSAKKKKSKKAVWSVGGRIEVDQSPNRRLAHQSL